MFFKRYAIYIYYYYYYYFIIIYEFEFNDLEYCVLISVLNLNKSNKRKQVRKCTTAIIVEKLSYCWQDLAMVWFFWTRLESMMFSKIQLGITVDVDPLLREIKKLLSYDKEHGSKLRYRSPTRIVSRRIDRNV